MKNEYYTFENIESEARKIYDQVFDSRKHGRFRFLPRESALLVIDMQKYFLDERSHAFAPDALPIVPRIKRLAELFLAEGSPVIMTRHANTAEDAGSMKTWWEDLMSRDDDSFAIIEELNFKEGVVVDKTQYDAFHNTGLEEILLSKRVKQVVITGVLTHLCCETTVRSAFMRGFTVFFPVDGTATYNIDFHRASFINTAHGFAAPALMTELSASFDG